jgi:hypothetical protein
LDHWLNDNGAPSRFVLAAPAGRGKSALLVHWLRRLQSSGALDGAAAGWSVAFVPISIRFNTNRPEIFLEAIAARLAEILGRELKAAQSDPVAFYEDQCRLLLSEAVERQLPLLLVIDGADEALGESFNPLWFPRRPGPRLRLVVSARLQVGDLDAHGWVARLGWASGGTRVMTHDLPPLGPEGIRHLLLNTGAPVDVLAARPDLVTKLFALSAGEPLILRLYVEDLWRRGAHTAELTIGDLDHIKPGFQGYFDDWLQRQRNAWAHERAQGIELDETSILAYLLILATTFGPVAAGELSELAHRACGLPLRRRVTEALHPLRRFVIGTGRAFSDDMAGYVLAHPKFGEFLREDYFEADEIQKVHQCIGAWGLEIIRAIEAGELSPDQVPPYILQYLGAHLECAKASISAFATLTQAAWLRAWRSFEGGHRGFSRDVQLAERMIDARCDAGGRVWQIRCSLILASIAGVGSQVPKELLAECVRKEVLTPREGLYWLELQPDDERGGAIAVLCPTLPNSMLRDALRLAWAIRDASSQTEAFAALAPRLSADVEQQGELLRQVFSNVRDWPAGFLTYRVFQLAGPALAAQPERLFDDAFAAARTIPIRDRRAEAVTHIVRVFNGTTAHLIERAVATVEGSREPLTRLAAMAALAPALSGSMLSESLELAWSLPRGDRALALAQLAPFVADDQRVHVALDALAGQANHVPRLGEILRGQDDAVLHQVLDAVTSPDRPGARMLISMTPEFGAAGQTVIDRAADLATWVLNSSARTATIAALAPLLPRISADLQKRLIEACRTPDAPLEPRNTALEAVCSAITDHDEALAFARSIGMAESRTRALAGLAAREGAVDAPGPVGEALDIAFSSPDPARALEAIVSCIGDHPAIVNAAIERAMALVQTEQRCLSLLALAPVLGTDAARLLAHAFRWCLAQPRFWQFLPALSRFPDGSRTELLAEASQAAWAVSDPEDGIDALLALADLLPPAKRTATLWDVAERLATVPQHQFYLARRLQELSSLLVDQSDDLVAEVIRIASHHSWDLRQDNPFEAISLALRGRSELLVRRAIDAAEGVAVARDEALASVAAALPDALMDHALRLVDDMQTPGRRAALLAELLPRCAPLVRQHRILTAVGDARPIMDERARVQVLGRLLEAAFEPTLGPNQDVANLARTILPAEHRYRVLLAFAHRAKDEDRRALSAEALAAARAVPALDGRAQAIVEVAAGVECRERDVLLTSR